MGQISAWLNPLPHVLISHLTVFGIRFGLSPSFWNNVRKSAPPPFWRLPLPIILSIFYCGQLWPSNISTEHILRQIHESLTQNTGWALFQMTTILIINVHCNCNISVHCITLNALFVSIWWIFFHFLHFAVCNLV